MSKRQIFSNFCFKKREPSVIKVFSSVAVVLFFYFKVVTKTLSSKHLLRLLLAPYLFGIVTWFLVLILSFGYRVELQSILFGTSGWLANWAWLFTFILFPFIATIAAILVVLIVVQLSSERLIATVWENNNLICSNNTSLLETSGRVLGEIVVRAGIAGALFLLVVVTFFVPLLNMVTVSISATYLGFDLITSCLSSAGVPVKHQIGIAKQHLPEVIAVGAVTTAVLLLPLIGILILPLSYLVSAEIIASWVRKEKVSSHQVQDTLLITDYIRQA
jgi:hypothetical protein